MIFAYSRRDLNGREWWTERFLEILPAVLSWGLLGSFFLLCIFAPVPGVVAVILFDLYWLFRLVYLTLFLVLSYVILEAERPTQWRKRLDDLHDLDKALERSRKFLSEPALNWKTYISEKRHLVTLERLKQRSLRFPSPSEIFHLIIVPFSTESLDVLESTLRALTRGNYPLEQLVVVMGVEERVGSRALKNANSLKEKYGAAFYHFEVSVHPDDIPGEAAVKGANATHAAKWAKDFFENKGIALSNVIVSCFDADTVVSPEYFGCLTYNYLIHPKRTKTSFQPIPVYHNNIWDAPSFARVLESGSSFFQLIEATEPEFLVTFSSHSMSFQALVEIGYWPVDIISDDSAIFWKALIAFEGDYRVEPLYVTLSMDVALGETFWDTCKSIYRQKRRWAWGVENFPIVVRGFLTNQRMGLFQKIQYAFRLLELNISWATWTPTVLILTWAPLLIPSPEFTSSVAHFNAPRVAGVICNLAFTSLAISIVLSFALLPKSPRRIPFFHKVLFALQWLLVPIFATIFGALPALDAQTRLALGRYMEFYVTPKGKPKVTQNF